MTFRMGVLGGFTLIFAVAAGLLFFDSSAAVETSKVGTLYVANFQKTIYASACAIMSTLNFIGMFIIGALYEISNGVDE